MPERTLVVSPYSWDAERPHQHNYVKVVTNTTGPHQAEGTDHRGRPVVTYLYIDYWQEECACGKTNGKTGSDTRRA